MRSRPYKRNYGVGAIVGRSLLCWVLAAILLSTEALALAERTLWVFQNMANSPEPTLQGIRRYQAGVQITSFEDSLSLRGTATFDARVAEVSVFAIQQAYLDLGNSSTNTRAHLQGLEGGLSAQIARYFISAGSHYGRLGIGYLRFYDNPDHWITLIMDTGLLSNATSPWTFRFKFALFAGIPTNDQDTVEQNFILKAEVGQAPVSDKYAIWEWGGALSLQYRSRKLDTLGRFENIMFAAGPYVRIKTGDAGMLSLAANWRVWIDTERTVENGSLVVSSPSVLNGFPDLTASWTINF